jgi:hypothetical protein
MPPVTRLQPAPGIRSRFKQVIPIAFGAAAALAALSLSPGSALAYVVTVGGVQYDVTTFTGSYNDNKSKFALPANGGVMPWWGNGTLASQFATQVGSFFGYPNGPLGFDCTTFCGPIFGYAGDLGGFPNNFGTGSIRLPSGTVVQQPVQPQTASFTWAQLAPPPALTPGPLPLFGAAAAFGFSRKLRKRIQESSQPLGAGRPRA